MGSDQVSNSATHGCSENQRVSVCVVTYNQENFIRQCLQSIVEQKVSFDFKIVVADDCSTDGTVEILKEFKSSYPDLMELILGATNMGPFENYKRVHRAARGLYVVHLDGDDYMLPGKLQRQVEYLDSHPGQAMVAHRMSIEKNGKLVGATKKQPETISLDWLVMHHPAFLNSSMMYRRECAGELFSFPEDFIDFYAYVHFAKLGNIGFINDCLGVYRASVGISKSLRLMPLIQNAIDAAAPMLDERVTMRAKYRQYRSYALASLIQNRRGDAIAFAESMLAQASTAEEKIFSKMTILFPGILRVLIKGYKFVSSL